MTKSNNSKELNNNEAQNQQVNRRKPAMDKDVYNIKMIDLIKDVLTRAAQGRARNHFFHDKNDDFKEAVMNMAATLTELGLACQASDDVTVISGNRRNKTESRYKVREYLVPTNIALFDVLNIGEFYTSQKMKEKNKSIGELKSDYTLPDDVRVLSPSELTNVYTLLEMTANSGWTFGPLTKPGYCINELSVLRGLESNNGDEDFYLVSGDGDKLSVDVLLATGLSFSDSEFPVKNFYSDEVDFNDSWSQLVDNLAINSSVKLQPGTRNENSQE